MRRSPAAANTRHVEHSRFGGFYRRVQIEYNRPDNPADRATKPRRRRTLPRPVGGADLSMAIQLADPFTAAVLTLAEYAGLRACEIAKLRGENIRTTQELMRHKSPDTTAIYAWVNPADGQSAVDALP